jgi:hypothetical protein
VFTKEEFDSDGLLANVTPKPVSALQRAKQILKSHWSRVLHRCMPEENWAESANIIVQREEEPLATGAAAVFGFLRPRRVVDNRPSWEEEMGYPKRDL